MKYLCGLLILWLSWNTVSAQLSFTENKGQWEKDILYKSAIAQGAFFITSDGMVYHLADVDKIHHLLHNGTSQSNGHPETIDHYAFRLALQQHNTAATFITGTPEGDYDNYFVGGDASKWTTGVKRFTAITQENVYDYIDLKYYATGDGLKYEFLVHPSGQPGQIQFRVEGITPRLDAAGNLHYNTPLGTVTEKAPVCYQMKGTDTLYIRSAFRLQGNTLSFQLQESYDTDLPLVIDPDMVFSTYSGGTTSHFYAYTSSFDNDGNMYSGGMAWGLGWPLSMGAFQSQFNGDVDVCLIKFNSTGTQRMMSTYYGGYGEDIPLAISVNAAQEVAIGGYTRSRDLPMRTTSYDSTLNNSSRSNSADPTGDIFVVTLNAAGTQLLGATYLGGTDEEASIITDINPFVNDRRINSKTSPLLLKFDTTDHLWLISNTSGNDFPLTPNAFQTQPGGLTDGILCQLNKQCSQLLFSSRIGGSDRDFLSYFDYNNKQQLVVSGFTRSATLPVFPASYRNTLSGGEDAYVFIFDPVSSQITHSTYLGTSGTDEALKVTVEPLSQQIYVFGLTNGTYPVSTGTYSLPNGNAFLHVLDSSLSVSIAATRIGHNNSLGTFPNWLPTAIGFGECNAVILAGIQNNQTPYTLSMPVTPNAYQAAPGAFWFAVMDLSLQQLAYATYLGTGGLDHIHCGQHQLDKHGNLYHTICSTNGSFPISANAWAPVKQNGNLLDIISFKFEIDTRKVTAAFDLAPGYSQRGCAPYAVTFENNSVNAQSYKWYFGDGDSSTLTNPSHTFTSPGDYLVQLYAYEHFCHTSDSASLWIHVGAYITPDIITRDTLLCGYQDTLYRTGAGITNITSAMQLAWTPTAFIASAANEDTIIVRPQQQGTYYIRVFNPDSSLCIIERTDSIHIRIQDTVTAAFRISDTTGCMPFSIQPDNLSAHATAYLWTFGDGDSSRAVNPSHLFTQPGRYHIILYASEELCHTIDSAELYITTRRITEPLLTTRDTILCYNTGDINLEAFLTNPDTGIHITWLPENALLSSGNGLRVRADSRKSSRFTVRAYNNDLAACVLTRESVININRYDTIMIFITPRESVICKGDTVILSVSGGHEYEWPEGRNIFYRIHNQAYTNPDVSATYKVSVTDTHQCVYYADAHITVTDTIRVEAGNDIVIRYGDIAELNGYSPYDYFWYPRALFSDNTIAQPIVQPLETTTYYLKSTHECATTDSVRVIVTNARIPNAFSPNGDGINDKFHVLQFRDHVILKQFSVFNRYGERVFYTENITEGWDGMYKGKPCDLGVYFYYAQYTIGEKEYTEKGDVTLLR